MRIHQQANLQNQMRGRALGISITVMRDHDSWVVDILRRRVESQLSERDRETGEHWVFDHGSSKELRTLQDYPELDYSETRTQLVDDARLLLSLELVREGRHPKRETVWQVGKDEMSRERGREAVDTNRTVNPLEFPGFMEKLQSSPNWKCLRNENLDTPS